MRHKDASWQLILSASGSEFQNTLLGKAKMDMEEINGNFLLRWNEDYEKSTKNFRQRLLNPRFSKFEGLEAWVNNKKVFIIFIKEKLQESRAIIIERTHKKVMGNKKLLLHFLISRTIISYWDLTSKMYGNEIFSDHTAQKIYVFSPNWLFVCSPEAWLGLFFIKGHKMFENDTNRNFLDFWRAKTVKFSILPMISHT